jgi:peptide deformylase
MSIELTNKTLYKSTHEVLPDFYKGIYNIGLEISDWLKDKSAYAVASNQLGFHNSFFVSKGNVLGLGDNIFINPKFEPRNEKQKISKEGCLSFPNKIFKIKRYKAIMFSYYDYKTDTRKSFKMNGINAIICQHEISHLMGEPDDILEGK